MILVPQRDGHQERCDLLVAGNALRLNDQVQSQLQIIKGHNAAFERRGLNGTGSLDHSGQFFRQLRRQVLFGQVLALIGGQRRKAEVAVGIL